MLRIFIETLTIINMKLFNALLGKKESDLKLKKEANGDWAVRKGSSVLYIGSKEKCQLYLSNSI